MSIMINTKIAKQIMQITDDFDNDYDQCFLNINNKLARHLSRTGSSLYNYLIGLILHKFAGDHFCISDKYYYQAINYLSILKYINVNGLDNVDKQALDKDSKMINHIMNYLVSEHVASMI